MATVKPFYCIRPNAAVADKVAALPYDVYNRKEATLEVQREPLSFLKIDRAETGLANEIDTYDASVYQRAKELLDQIIDDGTMVTETEECYYIYELIMDGRSQTGIVACASIDDYLNKVIKEHENTREEKELDRIHHVDICNAQTGPIFLAYRSVEAINQVIEQVKQSTQLYGFVSMDGVTHNVWKIEEEELVSTLRDNFAQLNQIYIADGHHRAASAVKVGLKRREENPGFTGEEEFNYFLSVLFPHDQLMILPYNRAIKDLNGMTVEELLSKLEIHFNVSEKDQAYLPEAKGTFGMYIDSKWYELKAKEELLCKEDPVEALDVSLLQDYVLQPLFNIGDPRIDKRIDFIGGIRGLQELERRVAQDMEVAFSVYPTSITELFDVSDAGQLMPPKSTWFEPKLRSGLFIHKLS